MLIVRLFVVGHNSAKHIVERGELHNNEKCENEAAAKRTKLESTYLIQASKVASL